VALVDRTWDVRWLSPDPPGTAARLALWLGLAVPVASESAPGFTLNLAGGRIDVARLDGASAGSPRSADERLVLLDNPDPSPAERPLSAERPTFLGVGWATVDLDRAAAGFAHPPEPLADDRLLGARCRLVAGQPALVLLEPINEGRLAASLARWGEGPAALYVAIPGAGESVLASYLATLRSRSVQVSAPADGPFGSAVVVRGGTAWGPHVVLIAAGAAER